MKSDKDRGPRRAPPPSTTPSVPLFSETLTSAEVESLRRDAREADEYFKQAFSTQPIAVSRRQRDSS